MTWNTIDLEAQKEVIQTLRDLANDETHEVYLSDAFRAAANELELFTKEHLKADSFDEWIADHKEELKPFIGKVVAIHLEKGVLASDLAETFWDGSFQNQIGELFHNDPELYITLVPDENDKLGNV